MQIRSIATRTAPLRSSVATPTPPAPQAAVHGDSFEQFFPYYLSQHRKPATRWMHFIGTTTALGCIGAAVVTGNPWLLAAAPVAGYGFSWTSHLLIEHNRPATFKYPFYSLLGDAKLYGMMWSGQLWTGDPGPAPEPSP